MSDVVVIGGINIDICSKANQLLVYQDSNVGKITFNLGGVGFNIACNLLQLGLEVDFISSIGDDFQSQHVLKQLKQKGFNISKIKINRHQNMSVYSYFLDNHHDMLVAVNDMTPISFITIDYLEQYITTLAKTKYIVIDTNLNAEVITWLANNFTNKILIDGVSTIKVKKILHLLDKFHTIKVNKKEFASLTNIDNISDNDISVNLLNLINQKKIKNIFVSNGTDGIYFNDEKRIKKVVNKCENIINASGAGDALAAGIFYSIVKNLNKQSQVTNGLKLVNLVLQSDGTISEKINNTTLQ